MSNLVVAKKNNIFLTINAEPHVHYELSDYFTFDIPNAKFMPQYRSGVWDGKIRLYSPGTGELYCGLISHLKEWCGIKNYSIDFKPNKFYGDVEEHNDYITLEGVKGFMGVVCPNHTPRDYQVQAVYEALLHNRRLLLSPTASGKSLMIYSLVRYYYASEYKKTGKKTLIIVPTTSLVEQMYKDFEDYGWDVEENCHKIYGGKDKNVEKAVIISTWQSIYKFPKRWFDDFSCVIGDEAHLFKSKSLVGIMTKLHEAKYRFGFTGTLDGSATHKWVLEGLFGECKHVIKTDKLIKDGHLSDFRIKVLLLKHEREEFFDYQSEIDAIVDCEKRNRLIRNLVRDLEGNTLVLFNYVERHGVPLHESINSVVKEGRKVFLVYGGVDTEEREEIRRLTEIENDAVIIASYGTFSTGINIRNLHNVVFASPSKSRVRNLQSIGRVLRKGQNKTYATLYDIADEFCRTPQKNYTLKHLDERLKIYEEEKFNVEIIKIDLK
jgi:superfamily II DNA or RNA helicase